MVTKQEISAAINKYSPVLTQYPEVAGIGLTKDDAGRYCMAIFLEIDTTDIRERISKVVTDCPIIFFFSGPITSLALTNDKPEPAAQLSVR